MSVIILLVCVFIQRYLRFLSLPYRIDWISTFYNLCYQRFSQPMTSLPVLGLLLLVIPPLFLIILIFTAVEHLVGGVGYWVLTLVWCWYCLDMVDTSSVEDISSARSVVVTYFHHVFAVIFWFLLGPLWFLLGHLSGSFSFSLLAPFGSHLVAFGALSGFLFGSIQNR